MGRRALITGITGQDGSYLAELLLGKGYEVYGTVRRIATDGPELRLSRIWHLMDRIHLQPASLESPASLLRAVEEVQPHECYHLAAQSFVTTSFEDEFSTFKANVDGTHYILSALRARAPSCRFYFAGSSEMFGHAEQSPQNELTPFHPVSPYAVSKVAGCILTRYYREIHRLPASIGILFNHESPRRGAEFVSRKITSGVANILAGRQKKLPLGNLEARRDWGHARDYVEAMWLMLQQDDPDEYVIATGEDHSVQEFAEIAFSCVGLDWREYVEVDPALFRPAEVQHLRGDYRKAQERLGWEPRVRFKDLIAEMVEADCRRVGLDIKTK
jgi:GDPmannose 4,6-dehydratase